MLCTNFVTYFLKLNDNGRKGRCSFYAISLTPVPMWDHMACNAWINSNFSSMSRLQVYVPLAETGPCLQGSYRACRAVGLTNARECSPSTAITFCVPSGFLTILPHTHHTIIDSSMIHVQWNKMNKKPSYHWQTMLNTNQVQWCLGHPSASTENSTESSQGNRSVGGS